jgi:hypothetical protein
MKIEIIAPYGKDAEESSKKYNYRLLALSNCQNTEEDSLLSNPK